MIAVAKLDAAIKAVCPIHGISIGRWNDKSTWRIDFKDEATPAQRAAARVVCDSFDLAAHEAQEARASANNPLLTQIVALEVKAHRAARDCLFGKGEILDLVLAKTPKQRLQELENQIAVLRGQLLK